VEALKEMDEQSIPWFQSAAAQLLKDMPAEKAVALALAKITGNTELKVHTHIACCMMTAFLVTTAFFCHNGIFCFGFCLEDCSLRSKLCDDCTFCHYGNFGFTFCLEICRQMNCFDIC